MTRPGSPYGLDALRPDDGLVTGNQRQRQVESSRADQGVEWIVQERQFTCVEHLGDFERMWLVRGVAEQVAEELACRAAKVHAAPMREHRDLPDDRSRHVNQGAPCFRVGEQHASNRAEPPAARCMEEQRMRVGDRRRFSHGFGPGARQTPCSLRFDAMFCRPPASRQLLTGD